MPIARVDTFSGAELRLSGRIDAGSSRELRVMVEETGTGRPQVMLDCAQLHGLDGAAARALFLAMLTLHARHCRVLLRTVSHGNLVAMDAAGLWCEPCDDAEGEIVELFSAIDDS